MFQQHRLHARYVAGILKEATAKLKRLPNLNLASTAISKQITICGDLHGKLDDLLVIFHKVGIFNIVLCFESILASEVTVIEFYVCLTCKCGSVNLTFKYLCVMNLCYMVLIVSYKLQLMLNKGTCSKLIHIKEFLI